MLGGGAEGALSALLLALAGSGAAIGLHVAAAFHFRIPFWYGFIFPLGYTIGALMALDSVHRRLSGRVVWKGRIYS
jgi:chlorobactene glucosyltransferase